ncbi:uncharacterized protein MONOS_11875 [Monocercomonoides exilis]|uniref:uncharacterized protein n=1 Tax=Monocercomonoides exilis TaxID=2049356 RepID=UPI00355A6B61|nr:hypothetical protein MONOS_11875 [Monocercomonoides exilis]|eukprot:MONOS_11875.1-p1 / transcript=MONOS_11875.1 / gene=MONOS_11875 / organism=Monocercomonoides_exilis_PA203 / gene_product=unspecified product / transcript_product=unspecified product / location=Mono_scaffold00621:1993-4488(+) / protein_length=832 / sequence_SO=supercontig / SO=protein_coding / is_pseudo=false
MFFGLILFQILTLIYSQEEPSESITTVFVKQSGKDENSGLAIDQEKPSLNGAYKKLGNDIACNMKIVYDDSPLTAEAITFGKNKGITIEGVNSNGNGNTEVAIDCNVHPGNNLFKCEGTVEFKYLAFHFPTTLRNESQKDGSFNLIYSFMASLSISNCRFIRPESEGCHTDIYLVFVSRGSLTLDSVECADEENTLTSKRELFYVSECETVILSNLTLKKVETNAESVIQFSCNNKCDVTLNGSTFSECYSSTYGTLYFYTSNVQSIFTVGDGGVTTFSSCSCNHYNGSGGIYLQMLAIKSANQVKWPEDGTNLIFDRCTAGEDESKRNIGIYLKMTDDSLFEDIANAMKKSFAANYTRSRNMWNVAGIEKYNYEEIDFISKYLDPLLPPSQDASKIYVKSGGTGNGESSERPIYSLKEANELLGMITREDIFGISILKSDDPIQAEEITFSKSRGIIIEGVNSDGNGNGEATVNCGARDSFYLLTCEKEVEFKYLAFNFPTLENKWNSLIFGNEMSASLSISNCRFVRVSSQSLSDETTANDNEDDFVVGILVCVLRGKVAMNTVTCTDNGDTVSFSSSTFYFSGPKEVSLNGVEISNVKISNNAAIYITEPLDEAVKISIEGLNIREVNSKIGDTAGLQIVLFSEESTVAIGRNNKCTFKSCTAPEGKAGAIIIEMPKTISNLQLPSANNLEIDSSNTANSTARSIFIVAPDFDEFCKQEGAFEFANDYDDSTVGWIVGAKDEESEPTDVYEKYLKKTEDLSPEDKKSNAGTVVAIVVPIVVVVVAVVVVVIVIVVKKRKVKSNKDGDNEGSKDENKDESKEQEMSSQE